MSSEKPGFDNPPAYSDIGGNANPQQCMPYPQPGGQGMAYAPQQQGMAYAPPQQGMAYAPPQQGMAYPPPQQQGMGYAPQQQGMGFTQQPGYHQNNNTNTVIVNQPGAPGFVIQQQRPPDYMMSSIFACFCCFFPTGLCAIYFASRANSLAAEGDMVGATSMANNARSLMITSVVIGVIWMSLMFFLRSTYNSSYYSSY